MIDLTLGIIGNGVVGRATARAFVEHVKNVLIYDVLPERRTDDLWDVLQCDVVMVCLPTPQQENGLACNTSALESLFEEVEGYKGNLVIRSTVPIGFTARMQDKYLIHNLVHSPEFLTARCALADAQNPSRNVIGVCGEPTQGSKILERLYRERWPHVPCHVMSSDESEAVKLFQNSFFSVKVAFWNECQTLASVRRLNWDVILAAILADGRISPSHTQVPGPDGKFGFGPDTPNNCLRKDLASLVHQLGEHRLIATVTNGAHARNKLDRERKA